MAHAQLKTQLTEGLNLTWETSMMHLGEAKSASMIQEIQQESLNFEDILQRTINGFSYSNLCLPINHRNN